MRPSETLQRNREAIRDTVMRHRACNPRVFGSAALGQDGQGSDLDLLVDPLPGATLFDLGGLQAELEASLGIPVDLVTSDDLPERLRDSILRSALPI